MKPIEPMQSVQSFRISDALRCTLLNTPREPNLACPRESMAGTVPGRQSALLWKSAVLQPKNRVALACWQGLRLGGLVSARTRTGHRAWEIDGFYLPNQGFDRTNPGNGHPYGKGNGKDYGKEGPAAAQLSEADSLELLEQLIVAVGWRSAERVFLRLPLDSPALPLARRSGFTPCFAETLLEGYGGPGLGAVSPEDRTAAAGELRPRLPQDDYALFQLFCAATPVAVREALGLTFDQWRDAREPYLGKAPGRRRQEWVAEVTGRLVGWVGINGRWSAADAEVMAHPNHPERLAQALDFALARPGLQRWLVPDYREPVVERLRRRGFVPMARYTMLVKLVAVPALRYGMAPVEA